jgi:uncharacterized membrane protein
MSLGRFGRDRSGNIAVLFAVGFAISGVVGAIAIDAAALYHERRMVQNGVDLAALAAVTDPSRATELAASALTEAGLLADGATEGLSVVTGHYDADPARAPADRFIGGASPVNAVAVTFSRPGTLHFARGWAAAPDIGARAVASVTPQVAFSLGSRLASLNGGVANTVLDALLGTTVSLSAADYNGLASARVDAFGFLDALAGELDIAAGTYDDVLAARADHGQIAAALAATVNGTAHAAAATIAATAGNNGTVLVGDLLALGDLGSLALGAGGPAALFTGVSALDLLAASAALGDGTRQIGLNLTAGVPGLAGIDAAVAVGEPMQGGGWFAIGEAGTVVRTAQVRARLVATVLGSGALAGAPVRLPLYLEVAHAEAVVTGATCPSPGSPRGSATLAVRPGALRLMLGEVNASTFGNFASLPVPGTAKLVEVRVLGIPVLQVLASGVVEMAQTTPRLLNFASGEIAAGAVKTAGTTTPVASLTSSLLNSMTLQVPILGLGLNLSSLTALLKAIVLPVAPVLDITIMRLLETVGLGVGEADAVVYGVRCTHPVLVG